QVYVPGRPCIHIPGNERTSARVLEPVIPDFKITEPQVWPAVGIVCRRSPKASFFLKEKMAVREIIYDLSK
ncbi:MAG TPA: hypothetical protein PK684_03710, partial [Bacillota bacterium]|nr:hypothetical protein [Bacillota bacterium]